MRVHLVRHAKAEKRARWDGPDPLRPLTPLGLRQARSLAARLVGAGVRRILSSPHLRCRQTLEPLAAATGLRIELHECLAKGEPVAKAAELLRGLREAEVVCCTHAELVSELAAELEEAGIEVVRHGRDRVAAPDAETERIGVIDMGSTSFHLLVADVTPAGRLQPVDRERVMLRLGAEVARGAGISEEVCERAVATARGLRKKALRFGAERLVAVGTAALRDAANGPALASRIAEALGQPVRMLSGEEEARLIFAAFRRRVLLPAGQALGLDLGGGSLELAVGDWEGVAWETTLRLGVARLHRELVEGDPMRRRDARAVCERVLGQIEKVREPILRHAPAACVAAGGTARALGHLAVGLRGLRPARSINQLFLSLDELRAITDLLVQASHEERLRLPGIRRRRADLLPTGALVLTTLAEALDLPGYTLTDWGLREGVLLDLVRQA